MGSIGPSSECRSAQSAHGHHSVRTAGRARSAQTGDGDPSARGAQKRHRADEAGRAWSGL
eukprot:1958502-Pyramimonas_sp.AAC.1